MTSDLEKSLKAKLRSVALEKERDPADVWQNLMLERFLVRLSHSNHRHHFILKGAILLAKYVDIGRETRDLDFLARGVSNEVSGLKMIFEEIASIDLDDGFSFREVRAEQLVHPHMGYPGVTVRMMAYFGHTRFKVAVDIGFGDLVEVVEKSFPLTSYSKGVLFEGSTKLSCYPKEFIFAEKLETIIYRGSFNSRMKDFHDIFSLIEASNTIAFQKLEAITLSVFEHRGTSLILPIEYDPADEMSRMQGYWTAYLKNLQEKELKKLPVKFTDLLDVLNNWLLLAMGSQVLV